MIRNFIYLDSGKLRSISSQIFEGVADSILKRDVEETGKNDSQKGPMGSGQVLADIFRQSSSLSQTKVLEDYAYTLFENEIENSDKIIESSDKIAKLVSFDKPFVRVTGHLSINDMRAVGNILEGFNELGTDFTRVVHQDELKAKALGKPITKKDVEKLATSTGMQIDKELCESLGRLIDFSSKGMLEFQIHQSGLQFSAPVKREFLREDENLLIQKYSRFSEVQFTAVGIVTQSGKHINQTKPLEDVADAANMKIALRSMIGHLRAVEDSLSGLTPGEVVFDPIAVYQTL